MSGGSEGPVMRNADALFGMGVGGATSSPSTQSMRVAYGADGTPVYKSVNIPPPPGSSPPHTNVMFGAAPDHQQQQPMMMMKKKRGRPRKYSGGVGVTDVSTPLALMPPAAAAAVSAQPNTAASAAAPQSGTAGGEFSPASGGGGSEGPKFKKARGRPPGSTNKIKPLQQHQIQPLPLGPAGVGFTPHVISVKAGEDVSSKIMSFSQNGPRAVCILSANGAISNVTLRQAATSGGTATYEGRFEILSLCGSFLLTEVGGQRSRTGGLSVSLAGPDGRVLGGCVAGLLTAASPVQVIVGSFISDNRKESKAPNQTEAGIHFQSPLPPSNPMPMSMQPMLFSGGSGGYTAAAPTAGVSSSPNPSQEGGSFCESSGEEEEEGSSPPNHSTGGNNANNNNNNNHHLNNSSSSNHPQGMLGMPWR